MLLILSVLVGVLFSWTNSEKMHKKAEDVIQLTPNTLNQAKFLKLQRIPLRRLPTRQERRKTTGAPILICGEGTMGIVVNYPFNGRIYASHREKDQECMQYVTTSLQPSTTDYHLRVVVSFNYEHLTEEDKIYDLTCTYSSKNVSVGAYYDTVCSLDESILPHPTYDMDNGVVYTPSKAFRFTKSRRVHFNCMLSVCHKNDADCVKDIPPRCSRSLRKRQLPDNSSVEQRLTHLRALVKTKNFTNEERQYDGDDVIAGGATTVIANVSTRPLLVDDEFDDSPYGCIPSNYLHWIYALLITNILSILVAVVACSSLLRRRFSMDVVALRHKYYPTMYS